MSSTRQSYIGMCLAILIISVWTGLHVYAVFFATLNHWLLSVGLFVVLTWLSVGLFIVSHDAMHGSLCPSSRRLGDITGTLALLLYAGFFMSTLRIKHHMHHRHPGSRDDPDFAAASPSNASRWYGLFMKTYFGWREAAIMTARVCVYVALGAKIENIVIFFGLPGLLSSLQLFYFGTFKPHRHLPGGRGTADFVDHHHARSNEVGYFASLLSCFHFGYHHEHHLHPFAPWWHLPQIRQHR